MATKPKPKPTNIDITSIAYDSKERVLVGLGKNGLTYFYDKDKAEWFKY